MKGSSLFDFSEGGIGVLMLFDGPSFDEVMIGSFFIEDLF
jgi:hypothetical protein